uniref:uncharacterized protein LOC113475388 n=1 Tax=Ciona intestinalis TaxID=7719 RepID=UPI000EF45052|nr:uncharacterized protein LOC113475388 [Ciona intestinalis]|eukprot:XP_026695294.1 uncharacterized protein LOC113475388 [Ciona intestinalis]
MLGTPAFATSTNLSPQVGSSVLHDTVNTPIDLMTFPNDDATPVLRASTPFSPVVLPTVPSAPAFNSSLIPAVNPTFSALSPPDFSNGVNKSKPLRKFWPEAAEFWFKFTESWFGRANVNSEIDKFHLVIDALNESEFALVEYALSADTDQPYSVLKETLLYEFGRCEDANLNSMFETIDIGNDSPSRFVHKMQLFLGPDQNTPLGRKLMRNRLLRCLPPDVSSNLRARRDLDFKELVKCADEFMKGRRVESHLSAHEARKLALTNESLERRVEILSDSVRKLNASAERSSVSPGRTMASAGLPRPHVPPLRYREPRWSNTSRLSGVENGPQRMSSSGAWQQNSGNFRYRAPGRVLGGGRASAGFCSYHERFGPNAFRCEAPCAWGSNNAKN